MADQQIKWLAYGGAVVVGTMLVSGLVSIWSVTVSIGIISVALLGLPIFTGIAIVRHRLYDIDLLINRTLVYGVLTGTLVALYFGGVAECAGDLPRPHRAGRAAPTGRGYLHTCNSSTVQPPETSYPELR